MAHADYIVQASGGLLCPTADIPTSIPAKATSIVIAGYTGTVAPVAGTAAMIEGEIMKVTAATLSSLTVERGCADTIPAPHPANATVWFFDNFVTSDQREYMGTETIGVKNLVSTSGSRQALANAPALPLTFNSRFARPYVPGNAAVDGALFYNAPTILYDHDHNGSHTFTWVHRNRVTQGDVLIPWVGASVTPEAGTSYLLKFFEGNTLKSNVDAGSGNAFTLTYAAARAAAGVDASGSVKDIVIYLVSVREGYESWQGVPFNAKIGPDVLAGWGNAWGASWGN